MKDLRLVALSRLTAVSLLSALVTACSSSAPQITAEQRDPIPVPASAITVQGQPGVAGGTLAVVLPEDIATFNPFGLTSSSTAEVLRQLYAPLIGFNPATGKTLPTEGLAQAFEADGKTVTIRLREGLLFSDGTPIRADDVLYSFKIALDPDVHAPIADMMAVNGRVPEVSKVDDRTVKLEFTESYPAIGYVLSQMPVVSAGTNPDDTIEKGRFEEALGVDTPPANIACSGPFRVGSYEKGRRIVLNYNPNYWKVDSQSIRLPYLDHVEYWFGLAKDEIEKRLENGTLNLAFDLDPQVNVEMGAGKGNFLTKDLGVGLATWQLFGNMNAKIVADRAKAGWMLDAKFREFLCRIMDRDAVVKDVFGGKATPAHGIVTSANAAWYFESIKRLPFDVTGALTALGDNYHVVDREGKPQLVDIGNRVIRFNLFYPKGPEGEGIQKIVVDRFAKAGVPVKAIPVEPAKLLTQYIQPGKFELVLWKMDAFGLDPISYMPALMQNGSMHWYLNTPVGGASILDFESVVGRLMRAQQDKKLDADRQKDFNEVQKVWAENMPVAYIVAPHVVVAYDKRLGNFQPVPVRPYATWNSDQLFFKR
jgi:peptide/nickel transport system substrate-binding protein